MYTIYGKPSCPFCVKAKHLLVTKGLPHEYVDVSIDNHALTFLKDQGFKTVPQVYLGKEYIGGYEALNSYLNE
jgi:glutaredoxin